MEVWTWFFRGLRNDILNFSQRIQAFHAQTQFRAIPSSGRFFDSGAHGGSGDSVLSAVTVPSQYYLGSAMVDQKTNEIPIAQRELLPTLDLRDRDFDDIEREYWADPDKLGDRLRRYALDHHLVRPAA